MFEVPSATQWIKQLDNENATIYIYGCDNLAEYSSDGVMRCVVSWVPRWLWKKWFEYKIA